MAHKTMTGGTAWEITGGRVLADGTVYAVENGRVLTDGTLYDIPFGGLHLNCVTYDSRSGASVSVTEDAARLTAQVSGGSGTAYAGIQWELKDGSQWYLLQKGDRVTFSFTGSRYYGDYASYGIAFFTELGSAWNSYVYTMFNASAVSRTYTVTTPCYCMLMAQIGGSSSSAINADIAVTGFKINGETVWAR